MATSYFKPDLSGAVYCVVSGASQGIGRAIAAQVSKHLGPGSVMLLLARNEEQLSVTAAMCSSENVKVYYEPLDLSKASKADMVRVLEKALADRKVTDFSTGVIFHNVGSLGNLSVETANMEDIEELKEYFSLNVFNVIALNAQFLKILNEIEDNLIIVNITSLCAVKPMSGMAYYCSGKSAREMYFRVLAEEKKNIRILNYSPGPVETAMIDYVLDHSVDSNLREVFASFKNQGTLLAPEITAKKCITVLLSGNFEPGQHVDYFDE